MTKTPENPMEMMSAFMDMFPKVIPTKNGVEVTHPVIGMKPHALNVNFDMTPCGKYSMQSGDDKITQTFSWA